MKKVLSIMLTLAMLLSLAVTATAAVGESGSYNPVTRDEIQKGTVIAFDSEEEVFAGVTYYAKILCEDDAEYVYALANMVYLGDVLYDAEEIADMDLGEITFVLRNEKIKYINPILPDGCFEGFEVKRCYRESDTIYAIIEFENIVDEFKLIMAVYNDENEMCSMKSFDISYLDSYYELDMAANGGDRVKMFFWEDTSTLVPLCELNAEYIPTEYGYLLSVDEANGEYTFEILTTGNDIVTLEGADKIAVDEESLEENDSRIADRLKSTAKSANMNYEDETNAVYHQPVMYAVDENGAIAHIDTVVSSVNKGISKVLKDEDGEYYYAPYGYNVFDLSDRTIGEVGVNGETKVIFVPDDRSENDKYWAYDNYRDAFLHNECYHYEAYGLNDDSVASLVVIYKENDNRLYRHNAPTMIVKSKTLVNDGDMIYIAGYAPGSNSLKHVYVADGVESDKIGKGDVIRYSTNNNSEIDDYMIWYDASNPLQAEECDDIEKAIENRILELSAWGTTMTNYPSATYRLQYGTVCDITLSNEGDKIKVLPTINDDGFAMVTEGDGVTEWEIDNSVKIYSFDGTNVNAEADLSTIKEGKTEVIAYSASGKLRALYIIDKPYISEKKIMVVLKGAETVDGYKIEGYSEGEQMTVIVNASEKNVENANAGKVIAYVPDGDTIKDIEIIYSAPLKPFEGAEGENYIEKYTKETLVYGLAEYQTEAVTVNGVEYTYTDDTNYLLMKYISGGANKLSMGIGNEIEMKDSYVLIRVKEDAPTVATDVVIFQNLN